MELQDWHQFGREVGAVEGGPSWWRGAAPNEGPCGCIAGAGQEGEAGSSPVEHDQLPHPHQSQLRPAS